ncbi:MAG: hypothetical protein K2O12_01845 [Muribaculaceae bacterium]|nr:hypothetical protein [Muribaculaceae bacterium]
MDIAAYNKPIHNDNSHMIQEDMISGGSPEQGTDQTSNNNNRLFPAIVGSLLTIIAWILLFWTGFGSFCTAGAALVVSAFGIRSRLKNLAITSIIGAAVLMLVFAIFEGLIFFMLRTV